MTTIIIDGATKAIYCDSQMTSTQTTTAGGADILGISIKNNLTTEVNLDNDYTKVYYISREIGYITATGDCCLLNQCVANSKQYNELTLPNISKGYKSITLLNVIYNVSCINVFKYTPKTRKRWFGEEHYWDYTWTRLGDNSRMFFGSGSDYAEGAYAACQDPVQAIIAASKCDVYTNANVKIHKLED